MAVPIRLFLRSALDLLYPPHCEACEKPGNVLCKQCLRSIRQIHLPYCQVCSLPVAGQTSTSFVCASCQHRKFHFQFAVCACEAGDVVRLLIHKFKYQGIIRLGGILSRLLFRAWDDSRLLTHPPEVLVPVPLHPRREWQRGFNQAQILSEALSQHTGIPMRAFLKRSVFTPSQTLLNRRQRMQNLRGAFTLRQNLRLNGMHVMLVDDVLTTGSTLEECSKTLLAGGARTVNAMTLARA